MEESEEYDFDEEIKGDNIEESSTLIPPQVIPVITQFDVFLENPPNKLPPMCDTQHVIESDSEVIC